MKKRYFLLIVLFLLLTACGGSKKYRFIDIPICANEEAGKCAYFQNKYYMLVEGSDEFLMEGMFSPPSLPTRIPDFKSDSLLFALISCTDRNLLNANVDVHSLQDEFSEEVIPTVCSGQKTIVHTVIEASKDKKYEEIGYAGVFKFPKVNLPCDDGTMIQENNYTFGQILEDFTLKVKKYFEKHKAYPKDFASLQKTTGIENLPKDPWGNAFQFKSSLINVMLITNGPDKKAGTGDDQVLCEVKKRGVSVALFYDAKIPISGNYREFLKKKGVE